MNIYTLLTQRFNEGRLRCVISSGQAVVLHKLAIMSKDGDWIIRQDAEAATHVLEVLQNYGARYRLGAPLDTRWLAHGWSSHFEFLLDGLRIRTDFVARPPRISSGTLRTVWDEAESVGTPFVNVRVLADLKKTNREKDFAVIGELARRMADPADQLLWSRSAQDIIRLAEDHPDLAASLHGVRPLLAVAKQGRDELEAALDAERRELMHANEARLQAYAVAAEPWASEWRTLEPTLRDLPLKVAHERVVKCAEVALPFSPPAGGPS